VSFINELLTTYGCLRHCAETRFLSMRRTTLGFLLFGREKMPNLSLKLFS